VADFEAEDLEIASHCPITFCELPRSADHAPYLVPLLIKNRLISVSC
jgi:hypothetical protein